MNARNRSGWALAAFAVLTLAACGTREVRGEEPAGSTSGARAVEAGAPVVIEGTTLDASSRTPIAGVRVDGPGGVSAISDENGRFELRGLPVGTEGELRASGPGELSGTQRLRPLERGRLEVVVYLRPKTP